MVIHNKPHFLNLSVDVQFPDIVYQYLKHQLIWITWKQEILKIYFIQVGKYFSVELIMSPHLTSLHETMSN